MQKKSSLYSHLLAIGSLAGTVIGLGMFGIPYVAARAGVGLTFFYLIVLGIVMTIVHLMYLEVTLRTRATHRFVGYVGIYLGGKWRIIVSIVSIATLWGSLLIYTIVGGEFLNIVLEPFLGNVVFVSSLIFFAIAGYAVARPPRTIGKIEAFFTLGIIAVVFLFFGRGILNSQINYSNFEFINLSNWLVPYGVIIFSFGGASIIPSLENILAKEIGEKKKIYFGWIGIAGTLIPMIIYIIFMLTVVGISGAKTSSEALQGLEATLGNGYVVIGAIIGLFALLTSFIALGNELRRVFSDDYRIPRVLSLFLALAIPLVLFLLKIAGFIQIMGFLGAIAGIFAYSFIVWLFYRSKKTGEMAPLFSFRFPKIIAWILAAMFVVGGIYNIISLI